MKIAAAFYGKFVHNDLPHPGLLPKEKENRPPSL
jgi:hypothetical protein